MGCHTWFYKKADISVDEAKAKLIEKYRIQILKFSTWIDNHLTDSDYLLIVQVYPEYTLDVLYKERETYRRKLQFIQSNKNVRKDTLLKHYQIECMDNVSYYINGKGIFESACGICDIFRIGGYPSDKLFSLKKSLDFLEANKHRISNYDYNEGSKKDWKQQLEDFWSKYPDGMIDFG